MKPKATGEVQRSIEQVSELKQASSQARGSKTPSDYATHSCLILCVATTIIFGQTVSLLLPGFQMRELEARELSHDCEQILWHWSPSLSVNLLTVFRDDQTTTYLVTCPRTVAASDCGVSEAGMTAIVKKDSIELVDINRRNKFYFSAHSNQFQYW